MIQKAWYRTLAGAGAMGVWLVCPDAKAQAVIHDGVPEQTAAGPAPVPTFMLPLRFEATYSFVAADVEVPMWQLLRGSAVAGQTSTDGYFTESRLTGFFSTSLSTAQSLRFGISFNRGRSGAPVIGASEGVPPLLRFWGLGGDLALVRHLSSWADMDFGLQGDIFSWGVANLGSSQMVYGDDPSSQSSARLDLASGYRVGWQAGLGTLVAGPVGVVLRLGGVLTKMTFKGHPKPLEAQGFVASLGVSFDLGRGEP